MTWSSVTCFQCNISFAKRTKYINYSPESKHFCSSNCLKQYRTHPNNSECFICKKPITLSPTRFKRSKSGNNFCSKSCSNVTKNILHSGPNHPLWKDGNSVYRKLALDHYGKFCHNALCPLIKNDIEIIERMLDVHHIDGNRSNNKIENLEVLCVWCHALKTRS